MFQLKYNNILLRDRKKNIYTFVRSEQQNPKFNEKKTFHDNYKY